MNALPRPVSPFNWMVVIEDAEGYHYSHINVRRDLPKSAGPEAGLIARLDAVYQPLDRAVWEYSPRFGNGGERAAVRAVFEHQDFAFFRWFSAYPVLHRIDDADGKLCVWFRDLRFLTPGRDGFPFIYGLCNDVAGLMRPYGLGDRGSYPVY